MSDALAPFCLIDPGKVDLEKFDPAAKPASVGSKDKDAARLAECIAAIGEKQDALFAENRHSLLALFQGMDTSGKDGVISRVFSQVQPLGLRSTAFKVPSGDELGHDFLWRVHPHAPRHGEVALWNRSHYEDVVTAHVIGAIDDATREARCIHINDFERLLGETGTRIVKVFLHISKDEQKVRLEKRLTDPRKHWKFSPSDLVERERWGTNRSAYEHAFERTSTRLAPWWIVPADSKGQRDLMVAEIVLAALTELAPAYPPLDPEYARLKVK